MGVYICISGVTKEADLGGGTGGVHPPYFLQSIVFLQPLSWKIMFNYIITRFISFSGILYIIYFFKNGFELLSPQIQFN